MFMDFVMYKTMPPPFYMYYTPASLLVCCTYLIIKSSGVTETRVICGSSDCTNLCTNLMNTWTGISKNHLRQSGTGW